MKKNRSNYKVTLWYWWKCQNIRTWSIISLQRIYDPEESADTPKNEYKEIGHTDIKIFNWSWCKYRRCESYMHREHIIVGIIG